MNFGFKKILNMEKEQVLGLDIGASSVKIVQLQKDESGYKVVAAGCVDIDRIDEQKGDINVVRAILSCLKESSATAPLAVCSINGPEVAVRTFKFPSLPAEEVFGAVMLEAAQVCPFNINESVVDYQLIANGQDTIKGILVASTERLIGKKKWFAQEASLRTALMDVDGLALLNCLKEFGGIQSGRTAAVLNVGFSCTTLAIIGENNLPIIRDIAYAGGDIIGKIADQTNKEPEYVKAFLSDANDTKHDYPEFEESLSRASLRLIDEVSETLRYYKASEKFVINDIYLCGGFAMVDKFAQLLAAQISANIILWNPFEEIKDKNSRQFKDLLEKKGPAMAVAAGLALRAI